MPSTYSSSLRLELIGNGERAGTWGSATNNNLGALIEQGVTGVTHVDITDGDAVLTALNGSVDEARSAVLVFTGVPPGPVRIEIPNANKVYRIRNTTAVAVTVTTALGTGYVCPPSSTSFLDVRGVGDGEVSGMSVSAGMANVLKAATLAESISAMGAAPIANPAFTGTPTAPTPAQGTNNAQLATTAFVFQNSVPRGGIIMWSGALNAIPQGWFLCDGSNGTPNLRDRFVLGAGSSYVVGATGGSTDAVVVAHNHAAYSGTESHDHSHGAYTSGDGAHAHGSVVTIVPYVTSAGDTYGDLINHYTRDGTYTDGGHSHTVTVGGRTQAHTHAITVNSVGQSGANANMPPYYALAFIMKA